MLIAAVFTAAKHTTQIGTRPSIHMPYLILHPSPPIIPPPSTVTPAAWGVPTASEQGAESDVAHKWAQWLQNSCRLGVPTASERGAESEVAHKWARWPHNPCRLGGSHRFRAGGSIRSGPQVGKVAT